MEKKKLVLRGPFLSRSGYGEQARFAMRSIRQKEELFDIFLLNIRWGDTGWLWEDDEERQWIDTHIRKAVNYMEEYKKRGLPPEFDISLQITIPQEWEKMARYNIGYTAGTETTKMSPQWVEKSNMMDKILVTSNHTKYAFDKTVYAAKNPHSGEVVNFKNDTPVEVVSYPVREFEPCEKFNLELKHDFNFLCNAQWSPRKNIVNTIKWWVEEFWDQDVGLIVKGNIRNNAYLDREYTLKKVSEMLGEFKDRKCSVYLIHGDLSDNELSALYQHPKVKCFINLAHGEGFGLPVFEAAYYGLPVIAPDWGGVLDFLYAPKKSAKRNKIKIRPHFTKVDYDLLPIQQEAVWEPILIKDSMWCFPKQGSYKMGLRKVFKSYDQVKKTAEYLQKYLREEFEENKKYDFFLEQVYKDEVAHVSLDDVPKVSLITSVYKAEEFIEQLMEDVTSQTIFKDKCEWIIINANKEGDKEEEIIKKYIKKYPENIVYKRLEGEDPGVYGVWNMAVDMATGEYLTNMNCDDRRSPRALEHQAKLLTDNPDIDLVYNDSYVSQKPNIDWGMMRQEPSKLKYDIPQFSKGEMIKGNLPHNNPMWRKSLHDKHGKFDESYKSSADWEFWLRCAFSGSKFKKASEVLGVYYFNPKGVSTDPQNNDWKRADEKRIFTHYRDKIREEREESRTEIVL